MKRLPLLLLVAGSLGLSACGSGIQQRSPATGPDGSVVYDSAGICDGLARIAASDRRSAQRTEGVVGWPALQPLIVEGSAEAAGLYDDAIPIAPDELVEPLTLVSDLTSDLADLAAASPSRRAFQRDGQELDGFADGQTAIAQLNGYARLHCGFTLADN